MDQGKKSLNQVLLRESLVEVKNLTTQKEESNYNRQHATAADFSYMVNASWLQ
jgi:hypothetical protein